MIHIAQVHLTQHLLGDAAVHRDSERRGRVVIQRNLFPDRVAEPVGQHQQQGICRVMVGPDQLDVGGGGFFQQQEDVIRRDDRSSSGLAVDRWIDAFIVERDARVGDRVTVEQQPRRRCIHRNAAQTEGLENLVDATLLPEHLHLEDIERGRLRRPEVRVRQRERGVHRNRPVMAQLAAIDALRRERQRTRRDQAGRIGIGEVGWIDRRRQYVEADLHRRRIPTTLVKGDGDVRPVQVRHHVGADGIDGGRRLHPDRLRQSAVVPPVRQAPGHNVLARPPGRIVDPDGKAVDVVSEHGVGDVEGERGGSALVVAEVVPVQPDVRDVVDRSKLQRDRLVLPVRRDVEILAIPGALPGSRGRRIVAARHVDG